MLSLRKEGLFCEAGGFHIDPSRGVDRALLTHAHSDHARRGSLRYWSARSGAGLVRLRLGPSVAIEPVEFGRPFFLGPVKVSFHPAGHILGSAQIRLELDGEVWLVTGDFKRQADPSCEPFEPVRCDVLVTEATFGTPSFVWPEAEPDLFGWWSENRREGFNSLISAYSLGKTQRILALLAAKGERPAWLDPSASALTEEYRRQGVRLLPTRCLSSLGPSARLEGELVIGPSSLSGGEHAVKLGARYRSAVVSGWVAGRWREEGDKGFVLSDHADWPGLLRTIEESGARRVYVQHRGQGALVRALRGRGIEACAEQELAGRPERQLRLFA